MSHSRVPGVLYEGFGSSYSSGNSAGNGDTVAVRNGNPEQPHQSSSEEQNSITNDHLQKEKHKRRGDDLHILEKMIRYQGKKPRDESPQKAGKRNPIFVKDRPKKAIDQYKASSSSVSSKPAPFIGLEAQRTIDYVHRVAEDTKRVAANVKKIAEDTKRVAANAKKIAEDLHDKFEAMEALMKSLLAERNNCNPPPHCS